MQQRRTNWEVLNRPCIPFFLFLFHFTSSLWSVWIYSLPTHTQQKWTSDKWYTHLDSYQCLFSGIFFQLPPCTICLNTKNSKTVMATAFEPVQSIVSTILQATRIKIYALLFHFNTWHAPQVCNLAFYHPSQLYI